jgi:TRAP-type C4-dicarboxylate transport system substrate-binding protein
MIFKALKALQKPLAGLAIVAGTMLAGTAQAQETVNLRLHHFLPPAATMHPYLEDWKERVEEQSNGRLKVQIFPAMQLGGTPPSLYDQAKDGQVDIIYTLPGYTPDRFPKSEVFDLPFIGRTNAAAAQAIHEFYEKNLKDEYKDVHMLTFFTHSPGHFHTREKLVKEPRDMRGLKIRGSNRVITNYLKEIGAQPVGMPVPAVPEALSRGVLNGAAVPLEVGGALRVPELAPNHTLFPEGHMAYTSGMFIAMNKNRYGSLPKDLQAVLDANSGVKEARIISQWLAERDQQVLDKIKASKKNQVYNVPESELGAWKEPAKKVTAQWIKEMDSRGINGKKLHEDATQLVSKYYEQEKKTQ